MIYFVWTFFFCDVNNAHKEQLQSTINIDSIAIFYTPEEFSMIYGDSIHLDSNRYVLLKFDTSQLSQRVHSKTAHGHSNWVPDEFIEFTNMKLPMLYFFNEETILTEAPSSLNLDSFHSIVHVGIINSNIKLAPDLLSSFRQQKKDRIVLIEPYHIKDKSKITERLIERQIDIIPSTVEHKSIMIRTDDLTILNDIAKIDEVYYLHYIAYLDNLPDDFLRDYIPMLCTDDRIVLGLPLYYSPYSMN